MNANELKSQELMEVILELYDNDKEFVRNKAQNVTVQDILVYLKNTHKQYLSKTLPEIEQSLEHFLNKFGHENKLLTSLAYFFNEYKKHLIEHIVLEEKQLFPYIQELIEISAKGEKSRLQKDFSIKQFIDSHSPIEDELKEVNKIIRQYSTNQTVPLPYQIFLNQVEIFELELRKHAIIEDEILVPMVLALEEEINSL